MEDRSGSLKTDLDRYKKWSEDKVFCQDRENSIFTIKETALPFPLWRDNGDPVNDSKPFSELLKDPLVDIREQFLKYLSTPCAKVGGLGTNADRSLQISPEPPLLQPKLPTLQLLAFTTSQRKHKSMRFESN